MYRVGRGGGGEGAKRKTRRKGKGPNLSHSRVDSKKRSIFEVDSFFPKHESLYDITQSVYTKEQYKSRSYLSSWDDKELFYNDIILHASIDQEFFQDIPTQLSSSLEYAYPSSQEHNELPLGQSPWPDSLHLHSVNRTKNKSIQNGRGSAQTSTSQHS